ALDSRSHLPLRPPRLLFVPAVSAVHPQSRNAPRIDEMRIQLDVVLVARKHLAKAADLHLPRSEVTDQGFLERRTETRHFRSACPVRTVGAALEAVTAQEIRMLRFHIPEPRHIDRVGPTSYLPPVHREWQRTSRSAIHDVVHQIVPQLAAGAAES